MVAAVFLLGAGYAWREGTKDEEALVKREVSARSCSDTAFLVIFVAEWGDLTQILTGNLAAHYLKRPGIPEAPYLGSEDGVMDKKKQRIEAVPA